MSSKFDKPDDVSIRQVEEEIRALKREKKNQPLLNAITDLKSILIRMNGRFDGIENRLIRVEEGLERTENQLNRLLRLDQAKETKEETKEIKSITKPDVTNVPRREVHSDGNSRCEWLIL
jgi:hypothetical protein